MAKVSKDTASSVVDHGPVLDRSEEVDGYTVSFVTFREEVDGSLLLKGLPDDRCQCPHWGVVTEGRMTFHYADREETIAAGEAFYTPAGHVPVVHEPGTQVVMFSPTEELQATEEAMARNAAPLQAG
jgi:uncharacterized cupin superfamily protein